MKARTLHEHERVEERVEERDAEAVFLLNEREEKVPYRHREGEGEGEGEGEAPCPCFADKKKTQLPRSESTGRLRRSVVDHNLGAGGGGGARQRCLILLLFISCVTSAKP